MIAAEVVWGIIDIRCIQFHSSTFRCGQQAEVQKLPSHHKSVKKSFRSRVETRIGIRREAHRISF